MRDHCKIIQYFLEAGSDATCFILFGRNRKAEIDSQSQADSQDKSRDNSRDNSRDDSQDDSQDGIRDPPKPTHAISLSTLLRQSNPPNLGELSRLMEEPKPSKSGDILGLFRSAWDYWTTGRKTFTPVAANTPTICLQDYAPFGRAENITLQLSAFFREFRPAVPLFVVSFVVFGETWVDPKTDIRVY
ncbi:hypothetical protein N658DRAFT_289611 [Parathielavia hyrcaniae]|uniref:Uncharacterized protein n=1 Tax=Parathielavia hyrcaniae TaxID=113614 RepID=A0AAN6PUU0_9PEZI|nr:hypothetical protein N658DRAFT_289611 [Parathielavia hyrcaniae]